MVGVAPDSKIIPVKVLDANGNGNVKAVCNGIRWAADVAKADFICMSLGCPNPVDSVQDAIKYALSKKVICFVAAGNSGRTKQVFYPANYPEAIAIGSIELFTFRIPEFISIIPDTFRSTGRFSWLLAFLFYIYFSYKVRLKLNQKSFSIQEGIAELNTGIYFIELQSEKKSNRLVKKWMKME
jgi:hypothetical protein